mmetsp:Transcript_5292/g.7433  ORF Transcript_5292/g.7433 Transcript_5292/m.7433 type:complete len:295 (+) Transcript_5292:1786-2670(+)
MTPFSIPFPSITHLRLESSFQPNTILKTIEECFPNVTDLLLHYPGPQANLATLCNSAVVLGKIVTLNVTAQPVTQADMAALITAFPKLQNFTLEVRGHTEEPDQYAFKEMTKCKHLKGLDLVKAYPSKQQLLPLLPMIAQLESLQLQAVPAEFIEEIATHGQGQLKKLRSISEFPKGSLPRFSSPAFANLEELTYVQQPEILASLKKLRCVEISADCFEACVPLLPQLTSLGVFMTHTFHGNVDLEVIAKAQNLENLELSTGALVARHPDSKISQVLITVEILDKFPKLATYKF